MGKLNQLLKNWPNGTVGTQAWFEQREIHPQLSNKYVINGWLEKVGHGAFIKAGDKVDLLGGLYALQQELKLPVHLGGKTALEFLGRAHFVPKGKPATYIYTHSQSPERYLPSWFNELYSQYSIRYIRAPLFITEFGLQEHQSTTFVVKVANTERALFELLALVPKVMTYQYAYLTMQGQMFLRDDIVQELLTNCTSQLVKRLFLHLAKKSSLPVLERLQLNNIDLGQGRRTVGKTATEYDPEFKIMVPPLKEDGTETMEF